MFDSSPYRQVFTGRSTENPLSAYLWGRAPLREYVRRCGGRVLTEEPRDLAEELADRIVSEHVHQVRIVDWVRGEWRDDDDSNYRFTEEVDGPSYARLWIAARVEGDVEMLVHFPDSAATRGVRPLAERPVPRTAGGYHQEAYWMLPSTYGKSPFGADSGPYVWTEVILPPAVYAGLDEVSVDARPSAQLPRHFRDRLNVLIDESERSVLEWSTGLPEALVEVIEADRAVLRRREVAREGLDFLPAWRPPPPQLSEAQTKPEEKAASAAELSTERLSAESFSDFLAITRKWIEPLARSPRTFAGLPEEDVSALLAATLNAAFPFAGQEVFSYSGKTDIYVRADHLDGRSHEIVFIVENHWWDGPALLHAKLEQLLSYCTVRDTEAALMVMVRGRVEMPDVAAALGAHPLRPTPAGEICGFPVVEVTSGRKHVRVALVVLDLRTTA